MSSASQLQLQLQQEMDTVKAKIQRAIQDLHAAEETRDANALAFRRRQLKRLRTQLEQLHEEELILLRAQTAGQLGLVLSVIIFLHKYIFTLLLAQLRIGKSNVGTMFIHVTIVLFCSVTESHSLPQVQKLL